jgi:type IV secretion system protein TrbL
MVGGTMRSSISEALGTRESAVENSVEPASGALPRGISYARQKASGAASVETARSRADKASNSMKKLGSKIKGGGLSGARRVVGSESIDSHRRAISQNIDAADEAEANRDFLTGAYQSGEFDVGEAADRGILTKDEVPAEGFSTLSPDAEGKVTYDTAEGKETTIDLNDRAQGLGQRAATLREDASKSARSIKRIRAAQTAAKTPGQAAISTGRAGKRVGKTGVQAGKASGIVFAGAMTRSPYAAYNMGKRGGKHLIGPGASDELADSADEPDIDWTARQEEGLGQTSAPPWDDTGGDQSETM